jgi:hypothetical protein
MHGLQAACLLQRGNCRKAVALPTLAGVDTITENTRVRAKSCAVQIKGGNLLLAVRGRPRAAEASQ